MIWVRCKAALRANQGEVAAIILEPVPANAGLYLPERRLS